MKRKYLETVAGFIVGFFIVELLVIMTEGSSFMEAISKVPYLRVVGVAILAGVLYVWIKRKRIPPE